MENVYVRVLFSYSKVVEDERVSIANEWFFFYIRIKERMKLIQSVFNSPVCFFSVGTQVFIFVWYLVGKFFF